MKALLRNILLVLAVIGFLTPTAAVNAGFFLKGDALTFSAFNAAVGGSGYMGTATALPTMSRVAAQIILVALSVSGMVFTCLLIYGGYIWLLARGNSDEAEKGKNIVVNAVVGITLVLLAYTISFYIISKLALVVTSGSLTSPPPGIKELPSDFKSLF